VPIEPLDNLERRPHAASFVLRALSKLLKSPGSDLKPRFGGSLGLRLVPGASVQGAALAQRSIDEAFANQPDAWPTIRIRSISSACGSGGCAPSSI
jgi:hypothetical protein